MNTELIFNKLYAYFKVTNITELAIKLNMSQPAVTNWIRRNSISAIKKKCRELGIYNEIFGELELSLSERVKNEIKINDTLLEKAQFEASKFGLNINSYIEHLIVQDLKMKKD